MKKQLPLIFLLLSVFISFIPVVTPEDNTPKNITFQPNVIPELKISFVEEFFRFQWKQNQFDLKLLVGYNDSKQGLKELSLRDFWEKTDRLVKWQQLMNKATESMYDFGYDITDIPQEIADNVEYLVWKVEGASFDVSEVEEIAYPQLEGYNTTHFILPDNLYLTYEDLWLQNFTVSHPNKLEAKVEGVKGKTAWNLDPITFSAPLMTVTGGSEGSPLGWWDLWNASYVNGWNVAWWYPYGDVGFYFNCTIQIGDGGTTETWFADLNKAVQIGNSTVAQRLLIDNGYLNPSINTHFRLGQDNPPRDGCFLLIYHSYPTNPDSNWKGDIQVYGSTVLKISGRWINLGLSYYAGGSTATIKNSRIELGRLRTYRTQTWERVTLTSQPNGVESLISLETGIVPTMNDVRIEGSGTYAIEAYNTADVTLQNIYSRDRTYMIYRRYEGDIYLVNPDVDTWTFYWYGDTGTSKVHRQYEFDLAVFFQNGSYAQNANVTISNDYLGTSDSWIISSNGSIPTQTYSMGHYNYTGGNTIYNYNPYNLTVSLDGYETYTDLINITQKENLRIAMVPAGGKSAGWSLAWWMLIALVFIPIAIIVWRFKK